MHFISKFLNTYKFFKINFINQNKHRSNIYTFVNVTLYPLYCYNKKLQFLKSTNSLKTFFTNNFFKRFIAHKMV